MKNVIRSVASCMMLGVLILSASCNKKSADIEKVPGDADANYWPDQRYCNIDSIIVNGTGDYYKFRYDAQGDPVSIIGNSPGTGDPNKFFFYNSSKKLIKYVSLYQAVYQDSSTFEHFTTYIYGANNRVARDTTYSFGYVVGDRPVGYYGFTVTDYYYDSLGRIKQTDFMWAGVPGSGWVTNYDYDTNGNLIRSGIVYDNRNNIHNVNNWFRFISRDYSKNNPYTASSYTGYWLPRNIFSDGITNNRYFLNIELPSARIRYICD